MNQGSTTNRPLVWEDEAPAESRSRRVQQGVPRTGRDRFGGPGAQPEMLDTEDDESPRPKRRRADWESVNGGRFDGPARPWWRPESFMGRAFFGLCALVVLGALAIGIFIFQTYLERDARFRIAGSSNIQATGLTEVSRAEMLPIFGEDIGRNIFFVPLAERRKELEAIPWVEHATVMRVLPDQIRVSVVERTPVAFVRQDQEVGLVDATGVLLSMPAATMAQHNYSFPVVTGINPRDTLVSRTTRMAVYQRLMADLDANNQHISEEISEIDLTDPEDARVLMPERGSDILAHFGEDRFLERYQRYKAHIAEWRQQYPNLAAVDLRYDQQVVLEMANGSPAQANVGAGPGPGASVPSATGVEAKTPEGKPSAAVPAEKQNPPPALQPAAGKNAGAAANAGVAANSSVAAMPAHGDAVVKPAAANAAVKSQGAGQAPVKPAAKSKAGKARDKARDKAALDRKRRAGALRTLQNLKKRKNSAASHRSAVESD